MYVSRQNSTSRGMAVVDLAFCNQGVERQTHKVNARLLPGSLDSCLFPIV